MTRPNIPNRTVRSRSYRRQMSDAECFLWVELRDRLDCRYVRQMPIGPYFADFACRVHRVVVECDGAQHAQSRTRDAGRDHAMEALGWTVLRFWNDEIFRETDDVISTIHFTCFPDALLSPSR